jgi:zinc D-Ala-D-Ala carboxypeptidase
MELPPQARSLWRDPNRLRLIALLPFFWFLFTMCLSGPTRSASEEAGLHLPSSECLPGASRVTVNFSWTPVEGAIVQWLDLTVHDNGFVPGTFMYAGALPGNSHGWAWEGIEVGKLHLWRVNAQTEGGWITSETGAFVPCGAPALLEPSVSCEGPHAKVTLRWAPSSGPDGGVADQWLDLSVVEDGFGSALTRSEGPLDGEQWSFDLGHVLSNVEYHYRINTPTVWGWTPSPVGALQADCDFTAVLPCGDVLAPLDKQHRLAADCEPPDLVQLPASISYGGPQRLRAEAADALMRMLREASAAGLTIYARSTYRSYQEQDFTFNYFVDQLGRARAERISARPGHSEHQLGTAADLTAASAGFQLSEAFGSTAEGRWLADNAFRFGFVVSYPRGKEHVTGYAFEPWHLRYIGEAAAFDVVATGLTLHEYLLLRWYQ